MPLSEQQIKFLKGCTSSTKTDVVNSPNHYTWHPTGIECRQIVEHFSYNIGSAIAYLWRHKHKNGRQDLEKAIKHIQMEIETFYSNNPEGETK